MQIQNIQGNTFTGVYMPQNFNPTPTQVRMIKTIKNNLVKDTNIYKRGKNFHDFLENKGKHFILSHGDYKNEIKIGIGFLNSDKSIVVEQNCGSYPETRLDYIVKETKEAWRQHKMNDISFFAVMLGVLGFIITGLLTGGK